MQTEKTICCWKYLFTPEDGREVVAVPVFLKTAKSLTWIGLAIIAGLALARLG